MKNQFESSETFTAYATISAGYYMIAEIHKQLGVSKIPILELIDNATGFTSDFIEEKCNQLIVILKDIIEAKKVIEADYTSDERLLLDIKSRTPKKKQVTNK